MQFHDDPGSHNFPYLQIKPDIVGNVTWTALGVSYRLNDTALYSNFQGLSVRRFFLAPWTSSRSLRFIINAYRNTLREAKVGNHFEPIIKVYNLM